MKKKKHYIESQSMQKCTRGNLFKIASYRLKLNTSCNAYYVIPIHSFCILLFSYSVRKDCTEFSWKSVKYYNSNSAGV